MITAVVGANWGDEGKGKITDRLAQDADYIVRYQGGSNAGHTIKNEFGKFALHLLPSGIFNKDAVSVIGNGVAVNARKLAEEMQSLQAAGVPVSRLLVSDRAHLVMSYHMLLDAYEEERLAGRSFGSTKSGIAPCYSDKYAKIGFQVGELYADPEALMIRVRNVCEIKNALLEHLYHKPALDPDAVYAELMEYAEILKPSVAHTAQVLNEAYREGREILLEGQLGALKDTDHGIYPMVTSSSTLSGFGAVGAGVPPYAIQKVVCVVKAYSSAVGAGAFVSEIFGAEADELRNRGGDGGEFGATTGRPRRVGWFDAVATRYGCMMQGATEVALTVIDVLGYLDELPICVGYEIDGEITRDFPNTPVLEKAKPVYETMPGWKCDIRGITRYEELPAACRAYIERIEQEIGVRISMVSNGPARDELIFR
ncbi:MAG: adenylosuccinate synthase [Mogibacterium sp.]|nr:adenylosuccinate synthase [Mogibacterium sp.]